MQLAARPQHLHGTDDEEAVRLLLDLEAIALPITAIELILDAEVDGAAKRRIADDEVERPIVAQRQPKEVAADQVVRGGQRPPLPFDRGQHRRMRSGVNLDRDNVLAQRPLQCSARVPR